MLSCIIDIDVIKIKYTYKHVIKPDVINTFLQHLPPAKEFIYFLLLGYYAIVSREVNLHLSCVIVVVNIFPYIL